MSKIILPDIIAVGIYNSRVRIGDKDESKPRTTTMFEIELPTENSGFSFIDDESRKVSTNTIICAKPNQRRHTARLPFTCRYIHMRVDDGLLCEKLMGLPNFIPTERNLYYSELFDEIETLFGSKLESDIILVQSLLLKLIYSLLADSKKQEKYRFIKSEKARTIDDIVDYIRNNITKELTLSSISEYVSMSPTYLHRIFREATGMTIREYIEEQRITDAIRLLTTTNMTLTEIALESGFSSQSYFSFVFKRKMKMTPRQYVKKSSERYFYENK